MIQLSPGLEIIGRSINSGYNNPYYLIRKKNKKFVQLTELLFHVVQVLQTDNNLKIVAQKVSDLENRIVDEQAIKFLIEEKLEPLGIVVNSQTIFDARKKKSPDLLLALKYRFTLLPEAIVRIIAWIFKPLFHLPVMISVLVGFAVLNIWLFYLHGLTKALHQTIYEPVLFLFMVAAIILSALFHEFGHAAGCAFGKGKPGKIGMGLYIVWPAFFTDLSDMYRLDRLARLRGDIGGVYFNLIFALLTGVVYFITHYEPLLILIPLQSIEVMHQLMPFLRLDGYFIVSDIVGIPDLFNKIKPVLKNVLLRKKSEEINHLKLWVRWVITLWAIITVPLLIYFLSLMIIHSPDVIITAFNSALEQTNLMIKHFLNGDYLVGFVQALQICILLFPPAAMIIIFSRLGKMILSWLQQLRNNLPDFKFFRYN